MEKRVKSRKAQTHTLRMALLVLLFVVALAVLYSVLMPYLDREREERVPIGPGQLATVRPEPKSNTAVSEGGECVNIGKAEECDDENECTSDICGRQGICEYANRADGSVCTLESGAEGTCKDGECVSS